MCRLLHLIIVMLLNYIDYFNPEHHFMLRPYKKALNSLHFCWTNTRVVPLGDIISLFAQNINEMLGFGRGWGEFKTFSVYLSQFKNLFRAMATMNLKRRQISAV